MSVSLVKDRKGNEMDVQIYTTPTCGYCLQAKNWFNEHGIEYVEHTMTTEAERLEFYQRVNNTQEKLLSNKEDVEQVRQVASVPQIFVNGERIGGYANLLQSSEKILKKRGGSLTKFSEAYKPFHFPWAVEFVQKHEKVHWIEDEVDLADDVTDWKGGRVTESEKDFITNVLRLFTQSDVSVLK